MPPLGVPGRARPPVLTVLAVVVTASLLTVSLLAGCGGLADPPGTSGRASLINDLANRLARSGSLTYTATYRLPGGVSATITQAQSPVRAAYAYPGGKLVISTAHTVDCRTTAGATTCDVGPPPTPAPDPTTTLLFQIASRGLAAPAGVAGLLSTAALDNDTILSQHDTTIAGENATCVEVGSGDSAKTSRFSVCVLTAGLLGSFVGTVGGTPVDVMLDEYSETVAPDAFAVPSGAKIVNSG